MGKQFCAFSLALVFYINPNTASGYTPAEAIKRKVAKYTNARGLAIIVTNDYVSSRRPLLFTHDDGREMEKVFNELKFVTHWEKNVTIEQHQQIIDGITESDHPYSNGYYKCITYVFSGHGGKEGFLSLQDGKQVNLVKDVIEKLCMLQLAHIPKLFFIDACRGGEKVTLVKETIYAGPENSYSPSPLPQGQRSALKRIARIPKLLFRRKRVFKVVHEEKPIGHSNSGIDGASSFVGATSCAEVSPSPPRFQEISALLKGNFLIAYATIDMRKSYRDVTGKGSAWMQILAGELRKPGMSVNDATAMTRKRLVEAYYKEVKPKLQQPETVDRLNGGPLYLQEYVSLLR